MKVYLPVFQYTPVLNSILKSEPFIAFLPASVMLVLCQVPHRHILKKKKRLYSFKNVIWALFIQKAFIKHLWVRQWAIKKKTWVTSLYFQLVSRGMFKASPQNWISQFLETNPCISIYVVLLALLLCFNSDSNSNTI